MMEAIICDQISSYKAIYVVSFLVNTINIHVMHFYNLFSYANTCSSGCNNVPNRSSLLAGDARPFTPSRCE